MLSPAPKPMRTPGIERRRLRRAARQVELGRASAKRRRTAYGGEGWQEVRRQVFARDGYRCLLCGPPATDPHHIRGVGAGGRSVLTNLISLCRLDHALVHDGHIARERLYDVLSERYGYDYTGGGSK
jgi:hypothetical protein